MRIDRIACLANSYKRDHRCVAGISLINNKWVRLVGKVVPRCLTRSEARYTDGKEVALLDVFEIELEADCGSNYHPEDVLIAGTPCRRIRRFDAPSDVDLLRRMVHSEPVVLQGYCDRIDKRKLESSAALISLGLLEPEDLWWWIREESEKRKCRAIFRLGHEGRIRYDLPVRSGMAGPAQSTADRNPSSQYVMCEQTYPNLPDRKSQRALRGVPLQVNRWCNQFYKIVRSSGEGVRLFAAKCKVPKAGPGAPAAIGC